MNTMGIGEFLGCVRLTGRPLNEFLGTSVLSKAGKKNRPTPKSFSLHKTPSLPDEKQKLVRGKITLFAKDVSKRIRARKRAADGMGFVIDDDDEDLHFSFFDAVVASSGEPHLTVQLLSCSGLSESSSSKKPEAFCKVFWDNTLVGLTDIQPQSTNPIWSVGASGATDGSGCFFRLDLSKRAEILSSCNLIIEVYDRGNMISDTFLGCVSISFWGLLRLHGNF